MTMRSILLIILTAAVIWASLAVLAAWVVQLIILSLTERRFRFLRWATLVAPALMLCYSILNSSAIETGAAGALLLGWALGWAVYRFQKRREKP